MSNWHLWRWPFVVLILALVAAHMYRFEPLPTARSLHATVLWDRWMHQVCVAQLFKGGVISCSPDALSASGEAKLSSSRADVLRAAGFTPDEIDAWMNEETKALQANGVSQAQISHYLSDSSAPRPNGTNK